ncbi:hypothetical protein D5H75_31390 [Bailinhaonella thermotolerans]|uniref:Uncharacterized protein n=1 Tax=Bailinhaonella thermotolerans TaxID=1070861 RepID=A0A3A4AE75_9ACTN|nr:hypothetical protein D5H75_31390 [Bailinhaonella thermotolerans]
MRAGELDYAAALQRIWEVHATDADGYVWLYDPSSDPGRQWGRGRPGETPVATDPAAFRGTAAPMWPATIEQPPAEEPDAAPQDAAAPAASPSSRLSLPDVPKKTMAMLGGGLALAAVLGVAALNSGGEEPPAPPKPPATSAPAPPAASQPPVEPAAPLTPGYPIPSWADIERILAELRSGDVARVSQVVADPGSDQVRQQWAAVLKQWHDSGRQIQASGLVGRPDGTALQIWALTAPDKKAGPAAQAEVVWVQADGVWKLKKLPVFRAVA